MTHKPKIAASTRPADYTKPKKPATVLTGKISQQAYDDVINRNWERPSTLDDGEPGNGD